jgi:REP element-mobilizing transposase RayT
MAVRFLHPQQDNSLYFITFTCYRWLPLFEKTAAFDAVYRWFDYLHEKSISVCGYVIMPNHLHVLLYFPQMPQSLNRIIANAKRFMAYAIISRLEQAGERDLLEGLYGCVSQRECQKGQRHRLFEGSFDAKECYSREFVVQKLDYIHHNPVRGKWQLAADFAQYPHSSASFYEKGQGGYAKLLHIGEILC